MTAALPTQDAPRPPAAISLGRVSWTWVLGLALLFTLANAAKPLVIDDPVYVEYAKQIVADPGDPYGFEVLWGPRPAPAMNVVVPAGLPYWLAGAIGVVGESPITWKLMLFPYAMALVWGLSRLLARFAPGVETPLLVMTVLSPGLVPSFNLMLDVPALSLSLAALAMTVRACESEGRDAVRSAVWAGLLAGIAMQTKYTALTAPAVILVYALIAGRLRIGLLAAGLAGGLFVGWESALYTKYGVPHFLQSVQGVSLYGLLPLTHADRAIALVSLLGAVGSAQLLIVIVARSVTARLLGAALLAMTGTFLVPALSKAPALPLAVVHDATFSVDYPELGVFFVLGLAVVAALLVAASPLVEDARGRSAGREPIAGRFLLVWLAIETLAYFVLPPYLGTRRVLPVFVVGMLICGRELARCRTGGRRDRRLTVAISASLVVATLFAIADIGDARARRRAVEVTAERVAAHAPAPDATLWFRGQWGTRYYAASLGFRPVMPGQTRLREGDWLVDFTTAHRAPLRLRQTALEQVDEIETASAWPWSTIPSYYGGAAPLRRQALAQQHVDVYRVRKGFRLR